MRFDMILALLHLGYRWLNRDKIGQLFIYAPLVPLVICTFPRITSKVNSSRITAIQWMANILRNAEKCSAFPQLIPDRQLADALACRSKNRIA